MADRFDEGRRALDRLDPPDLWAEVVDRADATDEPVAGPSEPRPHWRRAPLLTAAAALVVVALVGAALALADRDDREPATAGEGDDATQGGERSPDDDPEGIGGPCPFVLPGFDLEPGPASPPLLDGGIRGVEQSIGHAGADGIRIEVRVPGTPRRVDDAERLEQLDLPRGAAEVWRLGEATVVRHFAGAGDGACGSSEVAVAGGAIPNDDRALAVEAALRFFVPRDESGAPDLGGSPLDHCSALGVATVTAPPGWSGDLREGEGGERGWLSTIGHLRGPAPDQFVDLVAGPAPFASDAEVAEDEPIPNRVRTRGGPGLEGFVVEVEIRDPWWENPCHVSMVGAPTVEPETVEALAGDLFVTDRQGLPWFDEAGAIWPESALEQGLASIERLRAGEERDLGDQVRLGFARELLGWDDAEVDPDNREPSEDGRMGGVTSVVRPSTGESVLVWAAVNLGMRWTSVYRVEAQPPGDLSIPLTEAARVTITPEGDAVLEWRHPYVPHEVEMVIGHGDRVTRGTVDRYGVTHGGSVQLDHQPDTTGFVLLLLRDEDGRLVGATGRPLPAGPVEDG